MNLRYSTPSDLPGIKTLMKTVFGDSNRFIELFFRFLYHDNVLLYEQNNTPISMAFLLPAFMQIQNEKVPMTYLYACATSSKHRGKCLMNNIIDKAYHDICSKDEAGLFLLPASESLYHYYAGLGFNDFFYYHEMSYSQDVSSNSREQSEYCIERITGEEYYKLRSLFLKKEYAIHYPKSHFQLLQEDEKQGIFFTIIKKNQTKGISFIQKKGPILYLRELLGQDINQEKLNQCFFTKYDLQYIKTIQPGNDKKSAVIRLNKKYDFLSEMRGYFNFALD